VRTDTSYRGAKGVVRVEEIYSNSTHLQSKLHVVLWRCTSKGDIYFMMPVEVCDLRATILCLPGFDPQNVSQSLLRPGKKLTRVNSDRFVAEILA
jgi:hypothetical protein